MCASLVFNLLQPFPVGHTANFAPASQTLFRQDSGYPQGPAESGPSESASGSNGYPAYEYPAPSQQFPSPAENNGYPASQPSAPQQPESPGKVISF